ncbi:hypothetical protein C8F01DRAFT_1265318 [Mycena amicta]|nr:hypothetical protein C8F01DRAFT_1265318 [Mycena amicta]
MSFPLNRTNVWRIITFTLAGADLVLTMPGEVRLYWKQWTRRRISLVCAAFFVARYASIASLTAYGWEAYSTNFTADSCRRLWMIPNVSLYLAGMAVNTLVYIRTVAIAGRSKRIQIGLGIFLFICFPLEGFGLFYHRTGVLGKTVLTCKGLQRVGDPDWNIVFYSTHMAFDLTACVLASYYLVSGSHYGGRMHLTKLVRYILRDGILFFAAVFVVNLWVILEFRKVFVTGAASSLPLAVTFIASQHLVLSTQQLAEPVGNLSTYPGTVSHGPPRFHAPRNVRVNATTGQSQQLDFELETGVFTGNDDFDNSKSGSLFRSSSGPTAEGSADTTKAASTNYDGTRITRSLG